MERFTLELIVNRGFRGFHMFISPYVDPELGHWYIIIKIIKVIPCYKTITSVSSEAQVKNVSVL